MRRIRENKQIGRREFLSVSAKVGGGVALFAILGYGIKSFFSLNGIERAGAAEIAAKISLIEDLAQSLGGKVVYKSENQARYDKWAVVFPIYHIETFDFPIEPIIVQGRIMVALARKADVNTILEEGNVSGATAPTLRLAGSEEKILKLTIGDMNAPPSVAAGIILGNKATIIGIEDRALFCRSASVSLLYDAAGDPIKALKSTNDILAAPKDMTDEINRYTREYCDQLGLLCQSRLAADPLTGEKEEIVFPEINPENMKAIKRWVAESHEMRRLIQERSGAFVKNILSIYNELDTSFVQLVMGAGHLSPTCELLEENEIGVLVVSNNGINTFLHEMPDDGQVTPQYMLPYSLEAR